MANKPQHTGRWINGIDITQIDKHPNILIAASFWEEDRYHAAKICYRFMREIDDLVDDHKSRAKKVSCLEKQLLSEKVDNWIRCLDKNNSNDPFIREVIETIDTYKIPLIYFHNFAVAMQYDINHNGFPTFQSFLDTQKFALAYTLRGSVPRIQQIAIAPWTRLKCSLGFVGVTFNFKK